MTAKPSRYFWTILLALLTACGQATPLATETSTATQVPATETMTPLPTFKPLPTITPTSSTLAEIQTIKYSLNIQGAEWLLRAAQEGLTFRAVGAYAIDNKIGFLFGSFESGGSDIRTAFFRTEDGGHHWLEVMQPIILSDVSHVLFVQNGQGWASIGSTSEGLNGTTYWHTTDYGKSWEEIPHVNTGRKDVLGLRFLDSVNGQRILYDGTGNPNMDGLVVETTNDGGYTWKESLRVHNPGLLASPNLVAAYADIDGGQYGSHWGTCKWSGKCHAFGQDGSEWSINYDEDIDCYIILIQPFASATPTTYKLPANFRYNDGLLISSP